MDNFFVEKTRQIVQNKTLPLLLLLWVAVLKWFFEGVLDLAVLELLLLGLGVGILFLQKWRKKPANLLWALFSFNIVFSLLTHDSTFSVWGQSLITAVIAMYAVFADGKVISYRPVVRTLLLIGIGVGAMVMIHMLLGNVFNNLYFPLLTDKEADMAQNYYNSGYYFGLMYNPHEPAGLIAMSIAGLVLWNLIRNKVDIKVYAVAAVLLIPLLLTGKKGIFVCLILILTVMVVVWFAIRKQWRRIWILLLIVGVGGAAFVLMVMLFPEFSLFKRFHELLAGLLSGESADSTRTALYRVAFREFKENPLIGIGWRGFNTIVMDKYGFSRGHEVNCDYLQWLCESGIVGFVLCLTPVLVTLYRAIRVCVSLVGSEGDHNDTLVIMLSVFIQAFTLIYAFYEIPFFDIVYFSVYIISCAIINSAYTRRVRKK